MKRLFTLFIFLSLARWFTAFKSTAVFYPTAKLKILSPSRICQKNTVNTGATKQSLRFVSNKAPSLALLSTPITTSPFEENLYSHPPSYLIDSVSHLADRRLSIPDLVEITGKSFEQVKQDAMIIAYLSSATMLVNNKGELLFEFPKNIKGIISRRSRSYYLSKKWNETILPLFLQFLRVSIGSFLVLSFSLVTVTLFLLMIAGSASSESRKKEKEKEKKNENRYHHRPSYSSSRGSSNNVEFGLYVDVFDLVRMISRLFSDFNSRVSEEKKQNIKEEGSNMNFLQSCFSFLFGDGNPNQSYEENLEKAAVSFIRSQKGLVIAEQLIRFLPTPPPLPSMPSSLSSSEDDGCKRIDESYVLLFLIKYHGTQIVTKEGIILYQFNVSYCCFVFVYLILKFVLVFCLYFARNFPKRIPHQEKMILSLVMRNQFLLV
jgi:hypothetical protein